MGDTPVWPLEPHTEAKHIILRNYLSRWFRILGLSSLRPDSLLYIDGYAGPGIYKNGEDGSPIIAIKEANHYLYQCEKNNWYKPKIRFLFIEEDTPRYNILLEELSKIKKHPNIIIEVQNSKFEKSEPYILNFLTKHKSPSFIFIDPFGYNLSFDFIKRIMQFPVCEVFINFMFEFVNRFIRRDGQEKVMTNLFGTTEWKSLDLSNSSQSRKKVIHDFYQKQLETHVAKYVRSFEMKGIKNRTKYFLFYCTNHKKGLEKMKEAMWKVDTGGSYTFSDATNPNQLVLFGNEPNYNQLKQDIIKEFSKKEALIDEIEDFIICKTAFLKGRFKTVILKPMEQKGEIEVINSTRKKKFTYPSGTKIKFKI